MFYSFLGFLLEVAFARVTHNPKRDRKCFYFLPLCPVYGLGALLILAPAPLLSRHIVLLALWSAFAATTAEYLMSLLYETFLHVSFWDYSHLPFQIHGRVCLLFSLFWCGLGLLLVYGVQPLVAEIVSSIPGWLTLPTALFLGLDAVFTVYVPVSYTHLNIMDYPVVQYIFDGIRPAVVALILYAVIKLAKSAKVGEYFNWVVDVYKRQLIL